MSSLRDGLTRGLLAGAASGLSDAALTALRGPVSPGFVLASLGLFALLGGAVGALAGLLRAPVARWWAREGPQWDLGTLTAALVSAEVLFAAVMLAAEGIFQRDTPSPALDRLTPHLAVTGLAAAAAARAATFLTRVSPRALRLLLALALLGPALAVRPLLTAAADVDVRFLVTGAAFALTLGAIWRRPLPAPARALAVSCGLAALAAPWMFLEHPENRLLAARYSPAAGRAMRTLARLADFDGDGFSPLWGEGDCAPFDPDLHPFAADIPDDGIDQDCRGGDLRGADIRPRHVPPLPAPPRARPHVLLISVDTLRADHMEVYGYPRATTPRLLEHFRGAAIFDRALTVSPITDRALPSLLGGLYPSMYTEALPYREHVLADRRILLPERLKDAGYSTSVIQSYHLFDDHNLVQGFDRVKILSNARLQDARRTTRDAIGELRHHLRTNPNTPLFLWVHYYEPHARYTPPASHRLWGDDDEIDLYDAEIHYVDAEIGRLLDAVDRLVQDDVLVLFTADHGEEFLDHGKTRHGKTLYDEVIRVPLLVRGPGVAPRRIPGPVSLVALMPTLLEWLEIPPPDGLAAPSFADALRGGPVPDVPWFLEQFRHGTDHVQKIGVVRGPIKLILDLDNQIWEMYDRDHDPGERDNIYGRNLATSMALRELLLDHWSLLQAARALRPEGGAF